MTAQVFDAAEKNPGKTRQHHQEKADQTFRRF
jgi:hypothetical protein